MYKLWVTVLYIIFSALYLTVTMMLAAVSLALSILVLNVHHSNKGKDVPQWVEVIILTLMAGVFCMKTGTKWRSKRVAKQPPVPTTSQDVNESACSSQCKTTPDIHTAVYIDSTDHDKTNSPPTTNDQLYTCSESEPGEREHLCDSECTDKDKDKEISEWRDVSRVLDRLFFCLVLMAMLVASVLTLCAPYYATS